MLSGFKQFILRGNVIDMAVGVVIGAAFASVVSAFTKDLLTPLIAADGRQARFLRHQVHRQRQHVCYRRLRQCRNLVFVGSSGCIFLRRNPGKSLGRAHAQSPGARRSHNQEVPGVPERDSHRCQALCALRATRSTGNSGVMRRPQRRRLPCLTSGPSPVTLGRWTSWRAHFL